MKIKLIIGILFCILTTSLYAQKFGGGVYAGLNGTQLDGDRCGGYSKAGFIGGIYTSFSLSKNLTAQFEVSYNQKGSQSDSNDNSDFYRSKLNYVQMPLLIKMRVWKELYAEVGPACGILISAYEEKGDSGEQEADPAFDPFELSGIAGLSYYFYKNLAINIRFNYSLLAIRPHPGNQTYYLNQGQYNNVLSFTLLYDIAKPKR